MGTLHNMMALWNRWTTSVNGEASFVPYLDTPCAINRKEAGVGEEAADSGIFRFAPAVLPDSNGIMRRHEGLAKFMPKSGSFRMHAQEEALTGNTVFGDDFLSINASDIWHGARAAWAIGEGCVPHCERLAYMARLGSPAADPDNVRGWYRAGGNQANDCPLQGNEIMYGRLWGQGICDSLRVKTINSQNVQENRMPLPQGDVLLNDAFPLPDGTSQIDHSEVQPPFGRTFTAPPPVSDCYVDSESWGGWCPSLLGRPGDFTPAAKDAQINLDGWDKRCEYLRDVNGDLYRTPWVETDESANSGFNDLVLDQQSAVGSFDWRMLCTFMSRTRETYVRLGGYDTPPPPGSPYGVGKQEKTWALMYWDVGTKFGTPSKIDMQALMDYIVARAWEGDKPIVDPGTVFDVRIQAMVYSFKYATSGSTDLEIPSFNGEVLWDKMGYGTGAHVYVWSHTNLEVFIRQAMPLTA